MLKLTASFKQYNVEASSLPGSWLCKVWQMQGAVLFKYSSSWFDWCDFHSRLWKEEVHAVELMPRVTLQMTQVLTKLQLTWGRKKTLQVSECGDNPKSTSDQIDIRAIHSESVTAEIANNLTLTHAFCWRWQPWKRQKYRLVFARSGSRALANRRCGLGRPGEEGKRGTLSFLGETVCSVCLLLDCERSHTVSQFEERQEQLHVFCFFLFFYKRRLKGGVDSNDCSLRNFSRWGLLLMGKRKKNVFLLGLFSQLKCFVMKKKTKIK